MDINASFHVWTDSRLLVSAAEEAKVMQDSKALP